MSDFIGVEILSQDNTLARFVYPAMVLPVQVFSTGDIGVILPGEKDLTKAKTVVGFANIENALKWATSIVPQDPQGT